jgi:K+-transporting ATPase ATPase C chain
MKRHLLTALIMLVVFTALTGIFYPMVMTGLSQVVFHRQANGSMIESNGTIIGSELIGQPFSDPKYFWGRLSATNHYPYNASASSGSNLGSSNPALLENIQGRIDALKSVDPNNNLPIPVDLVTSSGSGLDPHISIAAADYQISRVARVRGLGEDVVRSLVNQYTQERQLWIFGELRVNVLELNLALDGVQ